MGPDIRMGIGDEVLDSRLESSLSDVKKQLLSVSPPPHPIKPSSIAAVSRIPKTTRRNISYTWENKGLLMNEPNDLLYVLI